MVPVGVESGGPHTFPEVPHHSPRRLSTVHAPTPHDGSPAYLVWVALQRRDAAYGPVSSAATVTRLGTAVPQTVGPKPLLLDTHRGVGPQKSAYVHLPPTGVKPVGLVRGTPGPVTGPCPHVSRVGDTRRRLRGPVGLR